MSDILPCDHEEADTRLFLHVQHARSKAIIKTVDTDVVIIAICCFKDLRIERLWIEFGCGSRTRFKPIHQVVSAMPHCDIIAPSLPLFHALTGCDTVPSMLGIGKKKAWTCWMRNVENFCQMFATLNWPVRLPQSINCKNLLWHCMPKSVLPTTLTNVATRCTPAVIRLINHHQLPVPLISILEDPSIKPKCGEVA